MQRLFSLSDSESLYVSVSRVLDTGKNSILLGLDKTGKGEPCKNSNENQSSTEQDEPGVYDD
jgi:hypothetical protein